MAYPTVLPIANIAPHIQSVLTNINNGLYNYNALSGQAIWMPQEIKIDFIAIDSFQALAVVTQEGGNSIMVATGTDTAVTTGTVTDASTQTTTHGETSNTVDSDSTQYVGYDPTAALVGGTYSTPVVTNNPFPYS